MFFCDVYCTCAVVFYCDIYDKGNSIAIHVQCICTDGTVLDLDDIRGFLDGGYGTLNNMEGDMSTFVRYCLIYFD